MLERPIAVHAAEAPPRARLSSCPPGSAAKIAARGKRPLGDPFGLRNPGVNLTRLPPGAASAPRHAHALRDEFGHVPGGEPTPVTDAGAIRLSPGVCAGFRAGAADAHHLVNRSAADVLYLEIGDRAPGESADHPDDDLMVRPDAQRRSRHFRKDGTPIGEDR